MCVVQVRSAEMWTPRNLKLSTLSTASPCREQRALCIWISGNPQSVPWFSRCLNPGYCPNTILSDAESPPCRLTCCYLLSVLWWSCHQQIWRWCWWGGWGSSREWRGGGWGHNPVVCKCSGWEWMMCSLQSWCFVVCCWGSPVSRCAANCRLLSLWISLWGMTMLNPDLKSTNISFIRVGLIQVCKGCTECCADSIVCRTVC